MLRSLFELIFDRLESHFNDRFGIFLLYQLISYDFNYILNQFDKTSDYPGILGLGDSFSALNIIVRLWSEKFNDRKRTKISVCVHMSSHDEYSFKCVLH